MVAAIPFVTAQDLEATVVVVADLRRPAVRLQVMGGVVDHETDAGPEAGVRAGGLPLGQQQGHQRHLGHQPVVRGGGFVVDPVGAGLSGVLARDLGGGELPPPVRLGSAGEQDPEEEQPHQIGHVVIAGRAASFLEVIPGWSSRAPGPRPEGEVGSRSPGMASRNRA
jgi:hypothetical protein